MADDNNITNAVGNKNVTNFAETKIGIFRIQSRLCDFLCAALNIDAST